MAQATPLRCSRQQDQMFLHLSDDVSDPITPLLPRSLNTESECVTMERGPRYRAYSELRESKLRRKRFGQQQEQEQCNEVEALKVTPQKKQVRFQLGSGDPRKGSSVLAQSVPDFSSTLRKENRKPSTRAFEMTPPSKSWSRLNVGTNSRGSKSASAGEKKGGGLMARKSCVSLEELKGLASAAGNAINNGSYGYGQRKFMI